MFSNERTTLDDCHLRYFKLQITGMVSPVNGSPVGFKEYPHMAAVGWTEADGSIRWQCGGSLILDNFVLTAAHCVLDSSNGVPDVVRLGDLDLLTPEDDRYAQQIRIAEIVRHFQHRFAFSYHDIALLRLERNVTINYAVIPACLWIDEEVRFKKLVATGWGKTGFAMEQTPNLLKVTLNPIRNQECSKFYPEDRKIPRGLQDHHICAVDEKMDTCEGDSGGPLQVKLWHNSRMTPFLVGITSFGSVCGNAYPGVYTKVASYHDWIVSTMRQMGAAVDEFTYNETFCAMRYAHYREFDEKVVLHKEENWTSIDTTRRRIAQNGGPEQMVEIRWGNVEGSKCFGVIVDEDTVLTVADCIYLESTPPDHIMYLKNKKMRISKIHVHPNHIKGSSYNNIAILKMQQLLDLPISFQPSCISHDRQLELSFQEVPVYGNGRKDINLFLNFFGTASLDATETTHVVDSIVQHRNSCIISERYLPRMKQGLAAEHFCVGNDVFMVPRSCDMLTGSPMDATIYKHNNRYHQTMALSLLGRDCGFGEHVIGTRLASHVQWMESVLLPNYQDTRGALQYLDSDLHLGDSCSAMNDSPGRCVPLEACSLRWKHRLARGSIVFCSSKSVICCSLENITPEHSNHSDHDLVNCPQLVQRFHHDDPRGAMVSIGWKTNRKFTFECTGAIITRTTVLTTTSCLAGNEPEAVFLMGSPESFAIDSVMTHFRYNVTDKSNDLALIKLNDSINWSEKVFPACLWMNTTHTPIILNIVTPWQSGSMVHPMYNSDCRKAPSFAVTDSQICVRNPIEETGCAGKNDQLIWLYNGIAYLIGLAMDVNECVQWRNYAKFTRISSFLGWISTNAF